MSRSRLATAFFLLSVGALSACDKVPLLAPTSSTITLTVSTTRVPVNGTATVTASVTEAAGTPVQNGTVVTFTSSFGVIEPGEARTEGGKATVRFVASQQSGVATIGAFSGATQAEALEVRVGGAATERVIVRADPQTIPASGGSSQIVATVLDEFGNRMEGVPVTFSTTAGQVSPGQAITDINGEARTTLTAPRTATVTAHAGAESGEIEVTASSPAVTITPPATTIEAGVPATFTVAPATAAGGNPLREVVLDFGDGTSVVRLGSLQASTTVAHIFSRAGTYTVSATATDTQGIEGRSAIVVSVIAPVGASVTLTGTPGVVSVSNALQQGSVTFSALATGTGTGASIVSYTWDFGDGQTATTAGGTVTHRYTSPGTYVATVTVLTTTGGSGVGQFTVVVNP